MPIESQDNSTVIIEKQRDSDLLESVIQTAPDQGIWVFGYGSLIWKPPIHYESKYGSMWQSKKSFSVYWRPGRVVGYIKNYVRRFWQVRRRGKSLPIHCLNHLVAQWRPSRHTRKTRACCHFDTLWRMENDGRCGRSYLEKHIIILMSYQWM